MKPVTHHFCKATRVHFSSRLALIMFVLFAFSKVQSQEYFLDAIDTATSAHYHMLKGKKYLVRLLTDTAIQKRMIVDIKPRSVVFKRSVKGEDVFDTADVRLIDTIGFYDGFAKFKTYSLSTMFGIGLIYGAFYTVSSASPAWTQALKFATIPIGLIGMPVAGVKYANDILHPTEYINSSSKYLWYIMEIDPERKELH